MINNFAIFKNKKKVEGDKQPDYVLSAKVGEEYQDLGGCWLKDGKAGKYFSVQLKKPYQDKKGWQLVEYTGNPDFEVQTEVPSVDLPF